MRRLLCCMWGILYLAVAPRASAIDLYIVSEPSGVGNVYPYATPLAGLTNGQQVLVYAAPNEGYRFKQWFTPGGATIANPTYQGAFVTMTGAVFAIVSARFESTTPVYSLTVTNDGNGTTSPSGTISNMTDGTMRTISATPFTNPAPGYTFDQWTPTAGIADPNARTTSIVVDNNKTVTALFKPLWHLTITNSAGPGGAGYTTNMVDGTLATVAVPSETVGVATNVRYRCTGWTGGSGSIPDEGVYLSYGSWGAETNSSIEWTWIKQYLVSINSGSGGLTVPPAGENWCDEGSVVTLTAVAAAGNDFADWTVGTNVTTETSLTLTIDEPVTATAIFVHNAVLATNGVPVWWLVQYGLTNFDDDAMQDVDHDGMLTWQEWVAGCDPTNINSVFRFTSADSEPGQGMVVRWPSISNRFYGLARSTNLVLGTNGFIVLPGASNMPATPAINSYTDAVQGVGPYFYRIDVRE